MKMLGEKTANTDIIWELHLFPMKKWNKILETAVVRHMSEENYSELEKIWDKIKMTRPI